MSPSAVVIGTGFGARVHVPALRAAGFRVEALVGRDAERTERRAARLSVPRALTSVEEALALPQLDAVTVASPPHEHASHVLAALAAGKHVICEKPFALDAREAAAMLEAARAAGVVHRVGFEFRYAPDRALVARAIAEGAIGEPRFASLLSYVQLVADPEARMPGWWWDRSRGGGWLLASGSHVVDQIRVWLGEVEAVSADLSLLSERAAGEDVAEDSFGFLFRTRSGAHGVLQQTGGAWGGMSGFTRVAGSAGSIWSDGDGVFLGDRGGSRRLPVPVDLALPEPPASADPRQRYTHLELGPYTRLCEDFRNAIAGEAQGTPAAASFADGLASMRILDAARQSTAERRWVEVAS